jgi:cytochrome c peroxidase
MRSLLPLLLGLLPGIFFQACKKDSENASPHPDWVYAPTPYELNLPASFPILNIPGDNKLTVEGVALGRRLYYDSMLDKNEARACASCHLQSKSFSSFAEVLPHVNLGWNNAFLWNGKVKGTLEDVMLFEVEEFFQADMRKFNNHPEYPKLFYEAFGVEEITSTHAAKALAQFVRTLVSGNSRYDKAITPGSGVFLTDEELRGYEIFNTEKGDCFHCHGGILFTDNMFHNNALDETPSEAGLSAITGNPFDLGKFKSPTLRNIELTAPYMHDGRYQTLEEVIDFYSEGLHYSPTVDPLMKFVHQGGIQLTAQEKSDLIAFLRMLTDTTFTTNPKFSDPF